MEKFEEYFQRADLDRDGRISGAEAVGFLQGSNLPRQVLAQVCSILHHFILLIGLWVLVIYFNLVVSTNALADPLKYEFEFVLHF